MQVFAPCLKIKFNTTPGIQGEFCHLPDQGRVHRAIGFPTDAKDSIPISLQSQTGGAKGMRQLGSRVSSEVADTGSVAINLVGHLESTCLAPLPGSIPILPVLAEQAIEGTCLIEYSQVLVPELRPRTVAEIRITRFTSSGTNPIGNTIRGKSIMIPADIAHISRGTLQFLFFISAQSTITDAPRGNMAFVQA